jgi:glyoxylase-like metal-dependent hydrolase (beta-lactamase superfamily II)
MSQNKLKLQYFPVGEKGFFRAPVLLSDAHDALLIDGGFNYSDGDALAKALLETGKNLSQIYISQSDPDYYFSLPRIQKAFPKTPVAAAPATLAAIQGNVEKKVAVWGPQLKENGPQSVSEIVFPQAVTGNLRLNDEVIEVVETSLPNRRYLWSETLKAVFGGVLVFSDVHVWVADLPSMQQRKQWIEILNEMTSRKPETVVPGHMQTDSKAKSTALQYTIDYLKTFAQEQEKAKNSQDLIQSMKQKYPNAKMEVALEIGAKVVMGEMKWG